MLHNFLSRLTKTIPGKGRRRGRGACVTRHLKCAFPRHLHQFADGRRNHDVHLRTGLRGAIHQGELLVHPVRRRRLAGIEIVQRFEPGAPSSGARLRRVLAAICACMAIMFAGGISKRSSHSRRSFSTSVIRKVICS